MVSVWELMFFQDQLKMGVGANSENNVSIN